MEFGDMSKKHAENFNKQNYIIHEGYGMAFVHNSLISIHKNFY